MINRIIVILLILLTIGIGIVVFEYRFSKKEVFNVEEYIPKRAALILKSNGLINLLSTLNENNFLCPNKHSNCDLEILYKKLDSLSSENEIISESLNDNSVWCAYLPSRDENNFLVLIPFKNDISLEIIDNYLSALFSDFGKNCIEYTSGLKTDRDNNSWYFLYKNGLLFLANRAELIHESLISHSGQHHLLNDSSFARVYGTSGVNAPATLYINHQKTVDIWNKLFKKDFASKLTQLTSKKGWMALDLNTSNNCIILQGFSISSSSDFIYSSTLKTDQAVENSFLQNVPDNVVFVGYLNVSDPYTFTLAKNEFLKKDKKYKEELSEINKKLGFAVDEKLTGLISNTAGLVLCAEKSTFNSYFLIKTKDSVEATNFLKTISASYINSLDTVQIANLLHDRIPYIISSDAIGDLKYTHACIYNKYIVFSESEEALRFYIQKMQHSSYLSNESLFVKASNELVLSNSNLNCYLFPSKFLKYASSWLNDSISEAIPLKSQNMLIGLQASGSDPLVYYNAFLYKENSDSTKFDIEWQIETDTTIIKMQQVTVNGGSYYFIQDIKNTIYFISSYGRVKWKKQLEKPVISTIHEIDYYKNGKIQLLFNTSENLYLIDKNGKFVEDYPIKFKYKATNGIEVANFENDKNYRFYIALENKSFVVLDKTGKKINGWMFDKTDNLVQKQALSFTHNAKDYIAFFDSTQIYLLNRKGENRIHKKLLFTAGENSELYVEQMNLYFRLAIVDANSKVHFFYPDGKSEIKEHPLMYENSILTIINDDYALADSSKIIIYSRDGLQKLNYTLEEPVHGKIFVRKHKHEPEILFFGYNNRKQIAAITVNGKMLKAFPIFGDYPFIFISLSNGSGAKILCSSGNTLLNYSLPY